MRFTTQQTHCTKLYVGNDCCYKNNGLIIIKVITININENKVHTRIAIPISKDNHKLHIIKILYMLLMLWDRYRRQYNSNLVL